MQWCPPISVPATLVTSMFLHGGWMHIIGNMLFLWAFGKSLEDAMGHMKFLGFYLVCGIIAGIVQMFFNFYSMVPTVGASGAIAGVMGAYLIKFPRAYIHTLVFIFFFVTTIGYSRRGSFSSTGSSRSCSAATVPSRIRRFRTAATAWFAHIGGFVAGMILVNMMGTRQRYFPRREIYW